jgi:hypothetical protein
MKLIESDLKALFDQLKIEGFNVQEKHKWTFYFYSDSTDDLLDLYNKFRDAGFAIDFLDKKEEDDERWCLQLSVTDCFSTESVHGLNVFFETFSASSNIEYDGFDAE